MKRPRSSFASSHFRNGRRALLLNRVEPQGTPAEVVQELAGFGVERLPDVPQDDELERAGAAGRDVFGLSDQSPALRAVRNVVGLLYPTEALTH